MFLVLQQNKEEALILLLKQKKINKYKNDERSTIDNTIPVLWDLDFGRKTIKLLKILLQGSELLKILVGKYLKKCSLSRVQYNFKSTLE